MRSVAWLAAGLASASCSGPESPPPDPPLMESDTPDELTVSLTTNDNYYVGGTADLEDGDSFRVQGGHGTPLYFEVAGSVTGASERLSVSPLVVLRKTGEVIAGDQPPDDVELQDFEPDDGSGWFDDVRAILDDHSKYDDIEGEWCQYSRGYLEITLSATIETDDGRVATQSLDLEAYYYPSTGECGSFPAR